MAVAKCPRRGPGGVPCGGVLAMRTDALGRVIVTCPRCVRRVNGICRECPQPVGGKVGFAIFCPTHKRLHVNARVMRAQRAMRGSTLPPDCPKLRPEDAARVGGLSGGKARAAALTPEQRREIARKAGLVGAAVNRAKEAERQKRRLAYLGRAA